MFTYIVLMFSTHSQSAQTESVQFSKKVCKKVLNSLAVKRLSKVKQTTGAQWEIL